ncbi:ribonuclease H2 subunit B isoform X1 [Conger conger]|uniref:ribonuclease H2 subunit B isoform X1 n=1 Tax=Conger conger TaxID=82655 RepID=UPI002A59E894|nr:ribonuclease H2 subunit B isoform X1 [Conger conger]
MASKKKRSLNSQNDRWVVIAADSAVDAKKTDGSNPVFVRLKNPATDAASLYLFGTGDSQVYEVKAFDENYHSWFIGQTVQRDGRLLYITPMDPLYLLLPYIIKAGKEGNFQPVEQVVMDEDFPACTRLLRCARTRTSLLLVAEEKEVGSQRFYRYSQEKAVEWLKKKAEQTVKALKKSGVSVGGGVKSTTYFRTKQECNVQEEDYLRYAHGLISEYISEDLSKQLQKVLQLPEILSPKDVEPPSKKRKLSDGPVEAGEDYTKFNSASFIRKPPKKMTAAQKSLAKADKSGMKSMSAFFSPKVKTEKN